MTGYDVLRQQVEQGGGLLLTTMEVLRDAHGYGKLGVHVRKAIHDALAANGLGHLPQEMPTYQYEEVRLFRLGTPIADTINAVLHPSEGGDQVLRQSAGSEAQDVLKQIRQLVCE
ncbi:hypothetical protein [Pseudonocardia abyssalis]|uniref:Uncharacterized protein n=1 Tax=Pseudonocardia abyssalis TaxID=2792008 RepID=A0ABS6UTY5_9PSEU|nr:hypothetical protein [Pseudonocardia abyssalis]MBW0115339.1 hypothetical protein [Pseudonocardia abyssalis]MBW0135647.1 hypothetical protein [Pseudonocardia abyssalis]